MPQKKFLAKKRKQKFSSQKYTSDYRRLSKKRDDSPSLKHFIRNIGALLQKKSKKKGSHNHSDSRSKQSEPKSTTPKTGSLFGGLFSPIIKLIKNVVVKLSAFVVSFFIFIAQKLGVTGADSTFRLRVIQAAFFIAFLSISWKLFSIQAVQVGSTLGGPSALAAEIIPSKRGQIYINDFQQARSNIPLTSTQTLANVWFDPNALKQEVELDLITVDQAVESLSAALNLPLDEVRKTITTELEKEKPLRYVVIAKYITPTQKTAVQYLRNPYLQDSNSESFTRPFTNWLGFEDVDGRFYPENELFAASIGFTARNAVPRDQAIDAGCKDTVFRNEDRGTTNTYIPGDNSKASYTVGYYGLEQKYCSLLSGLNGRRVLNNELGTKAEDDARVVNGASLYLTIDRNIQRKAEEVLANTVASNNTARDGSIIVMEVETGKVLAMASYPTFNPNEYERADSKAFRNVATSVDYEVGSVIKPITVAMVQNEWALGATNSDGKRLGLPSDWTFDDYKPTRTSTGMVYGKPYQERNGNVLYLANSEGAYYGTGLTFSNILRDSINTGIAEMLPSIEPEQYTYFKSREYLVEKFKFGKPTQIDMPGDVHGNILPLDQNVYSDFTYATHAFGQGFTASPIQLMRGYTPLANDGYLVEPYLVDKVEYSDGTIDDGTGPNSLIKKSTPTQIITTQVSKNVTQYLVDTIDQGFKGQKPSKGQTPGYTVAGKTGTAEVSRTDNIAKCATGENIYECNRRLGVYDHTYIGYGPAADPKLMVLVKLSEPNPGNPRNFAENTSGNAFSQMMGYSLDYIGIPKEAGR